MSLESLYGESPYWLQNLMCSAKGFLILRERFNNDFFEHLAQLKKSQHASRDEIYRYKEEHLAYILEYAYTNVPFYREFYKAHHVSPADFKKMDDIRKFPVVTKEMVRENYKNMISEVFSVDEMTH